MSDITLSANNLWKSYGEHAALAGASLDLREGEILALLGPNGAGKTTFIKILATLLTKDRGQVKILGLDLDKEPEAIRHLFGYVGQDTERSAYARLTARENLQFFGKLRGLSKGEIEEQIGKLAAQFEFEANLDKQFVTLSGGQKQTIVIMRALLHDPPLVYLDEPTKGLDPIVAKRIRTFLRRLVTEGGKSLLLTSHVLSEVEEMADRVALIHGGSIPITGTPDGLKTGIGATEFVEIEAAGLPDRTHEAILQLESVQFEIERRGGWYSFAVSDSMAGAEAIIGVLRAHDVVTGFRYHSATLEDAFIYHIGELSETFEH